MPDTSTTAAGAAAPPVGEPVDKVPARRPDERALFGRWVTMEPVSEARHGGDLWQSFAHSDPGGGLWTYMGYGPFASEAAFREWLKGCQASRDPHFYAIVPRASGPLAGRAAGMASLMRITPEHGVIEIGNIWLAPRLQQTREATDALFVVMRHALDELGYRRLEWKCDALNAASRRAALRLGFTFEGVFRQHMVYKGRNRDTAWYAILDHEWPDLRAAFQAWLSDDNFDAEGRQRAPLGAFMAPKSKAPKSKAPKPKPPQPKPRRKRVATKQAR
jgi:RimJ/RimL family protein N-acetyltransferase